MRRWPVLLAAFIVLLLAYAAWPLLGLWRIASAVEARDARTFIALVDIPEMKRSLAAQIVRAHLKATGKDRRMSPLAIDLAVRAGMTVADAYILEIVKAEALIDLLKEAHAGTFRGGSVGAPRWGLPNLRNVRGLLAAEYFGRDFFVTTPLSAAENDGFRLRLRLVQWQWKLAGIDLPEAVQMRLEREIRARDAIR